MFQQLERKADRYVRLRPPAHFRQLSVRLGILGRSMARAQQLAAEGDEQILEGHGTEGRLKYEQAIKLEPLDAQARLRG